MFENCRTPQDVAYIYARRYGFPVRLFDRRLYFVADSDWGAISMPVLLARRVRAEIGEDVAMPIIRHGHRSERWVFVARRNQGHLMQSWLTTLERNDVRLVSNGSRVWLPMTHAGLGWTWYSQPQVGAGLPTRRRLLNAALTVIETDEASANRVGKR